MSSIQLFEDSSRPLFSAARPNLVEGKKEIINIVSIVDDFDLFSILGILFCLVIKVFGYISFSKTGEKMRFFFFLLFSLHMKNGREWMKEKEVITGGQRTRSD